MFNMENNESKSTSTAVRFHEATHRYFLNKNGRELIAVSKILELAGIISFDMVKFEDRERAAYMGDCVHETARQFGLGTLDLDELDPLLIGYFEAIQKFYANRVKKILFIEKIIFDERLGYAGTVDIVYQDFQNKICLDDFKTGEAIPGYQIQTILYKKAWEKNFKLPIEERAVVMVNANGSFDPKRDRVRHTERKDYDVAMHALAIAYWKIENKMR